ncbi:MAG: hypothetical protein KGI52_03815 [Burkholderiales bacterium]|nr:hypothetical protein [Burkholderiales bacterium]
MATDIDPVQFGALTAQVKTLETQVEELRADVKALLELANQSKGGFWMGMAVASSVGGFVGWVVSHMPWVVSK